METSDSHLEVFSWVYVQISDIQVVIGVFLVIVIISIRLV